MSRLEVTDLLIHAISFGKEEKPMSKSHKKPAIIDLLQLSDTERSDFIGATKKSLRVKLEEAKFWRTLAQHDRVTINGFSIDSEPSNPQLPEQSSYTVSLS